MYYYLLYNSSFSFIDENRLFSTILYGSILYILTHAILNYCDVSILNIINNYFWTTLTLDIMSFTYAIYNSFMNNDNGYSNNTNLNVSFDLFKNKINTMLDRKNDLTITHIPNKNQVQHTNNQQTNIQEKFNNIKTYNNTKSTNDSLDNFDFTDLDNVIQPQTSQELSQFSTPIKKLQNNNNTNNNSNNNTNNNTNMLKSSTPISLIRNTTKITEPIINDDIIEGNNMSNESIAGSDVGSIMDLDDFEKSF